MVTVRRRLRGGEDEDEGASAVISLLSMVAGVLVVGLVVVVDVSAWLWAAARAQAAADGAALAAVTATDDPRLAAREVAVLSGGDLAACDCPLGARRVRVAVRLPVGGLVLHRVWASSVDAEAEAVARWEPWRRPAATRGDPGRAEVDLAPSPHR